MSLTGDFKALEKVHLKMEDLADMDGPAHRDIANGVGKMLKLLIREQYDEGIDPSGTPWEETVEGEPALVSKKLRTGFVYKVEEGDLLGVFKVPWLWTHHGGFTFPPRKVAGRKVTLDKAGRFISGKRMKKTKLVFDVFAPAHTIAARTLAERPQYPDGELPERWQEGIAQGVTQGMLRWYGR